jgi:hypothetical protein
MTNKTLSVGSELIRDDGKIFVCTYLGHWSDVQAADGEVDYVKWLGNEQWVAATSGHAFTLLGT